MKNHVKDVSFSEEGLTKIEWADANMPVLESIRDEFEKSKPLKGLRVACCLHVTTETANLMRTLRAGGAEVRLCGSNPLSTSDDVAASLVKDFGIPVFAIRGEDDKTYYDHIESVLDMKPHVTMDDGADLISSLHSRRSELVGGVLGGTEETTTGVIRLKNMEKDSALKYPVIAVNESKTKHLFDNRYGTGQSTIDGILRATNTLIAGSVFVVAGYGWCGRGIAMRALGMGARVIVTEVNPVKGLEAIMDGFQVMPIEEAAKIGDIFVTATGNKHVIAAELFELMKNRAILANSGHFDVEIDVKGLEKAAKSKRKIRESAEEYVLPNGRRVVLLAQGRLVNLSAAEGHPARVMDMSFANQSLAAKHIKDNHSSLEKRVYTLPDEIDHQIAMLKLESLGVSIDELTDEQKAYLAAWQEGT
ncbi:adenosylhomocysteinase [candidate division TA06 bacterium]|uniref:Adenosylhomocysteinase n=1 Tax=candidate division TA06 bacterium TaxID=2250710 RepID=A0A523XQA2_UNCT6|nr:MAG: adenosylhomocysteinase [candidate division TA06 bacterium]